MLLGIGVGGHERSADSRVEVGQARSIHSVAKPTARVANPAVLASSPNIHPVASVVQPAYLATLAANICSSVFSRGHLCDIDLNTFYAICCYYRAGLQIRQSQQLFYKVVSTRLFAKS